MHHSRVQAAYPATIYPRNDMGNQGSWHLDHIRPCAAWDLTKPSEQAGCFHYTNYQPLWAKDNLSKGAKLDWLPSAEPSYTMLNDQPTSTNDIAGKRFYQTVQPLCQALSFSFHWQATEFSCLLHRHQSHSAVIYSS